MPPRHLLKRARLGLALLVFAGLTAAFVDVHAWMPWLVGHALASFQFVPSLVALVTGASLALACLIVLFATLAAGRIYCSVLCPLGLLQDVVARLARFVQRKRLLPHRPARTWLRQTFLWAAVAGVIAGWSGLTLSLLDPYSIFGRFASDLFRPIASLLNNVLAKAAAFAGIEGLNRVEWQWAGVGALALPAAMLLVIVVLAAWRGRIYCNTVCPVGTVLGLVASRGAFRLGIDRSACHKCGECLRACKAQCIDLRAGTIDASRCVNCFNCLDVCKERAVNYRWTWRPRPPAPAAAPQSPRVAPSRAGSAPNPDRRAFITGVGSALTAAVGGGALLAMTAAENKAGKRRHPGGSVVAPPGAGSIDRLLDRCTACHLCISACPTQVLQPAFLEYGFGGLMKPRLDYDVAFCNFDCQKCSDVCPDGALLPMALAEKHRTRIGVAHLNTDHCIVKEHHTDCAACSEHCPTKAVDTEPFGDNLRLPKVNEDLCIGCGACEYACPATPHKAIRVEGARQHGVAEIAHEEKARDPHPTGDFPF